MTQRQQQEIRKSVSEFDVSHPLNKHFMWQMAKCTLLSHTEQRPYSHHVLATTCQQITQIYSANYVHIFVQDHQSSIHKHSVTFPAFTHSQPSARNFNTMTQCVMLQYTYIISKKSFWYFDKMSEKGKRNVHWNMHAPTDMDFILLAEDRHQWPVLDNAVRIFRFHTM